MTGVPDRRPRLRPELGDEPTMQCSSEVQCLTSRPQRLTELYLDYMYRGNIYINIWIKSLFKIHWTLDQ